MRRVIPQGAASSLAQPAPAKAGNKAVCAKTKLGQTKFATKLRVPVGALCYWEEYRRSPDAPARTLLGMVAAESNAATALIDRLAG